MNQRIVTSLLAYLLLVLLGCESSRREQPDDEPADSIALAYQAANLQIKILRDSLLHATKGSESALATESTADSLKSVRRKAMAHIQSLEKNIYQLEAELHAYSDSLHQVKSLHTTKKNAAPTRNKALDSLTLAHRTAEKTIKRLQDSLVLLRTAYLHKQDSIKELSDVLHQMQTAHQEQQRATEDRRQLQTTAEREALSQEVLRLADRLKQEQLKVAELTDTLALVRKQLHRQPVQKKLPPGTTALSEAFKILLQAKRVEESDPTLALQLMQEALKLSKDSALVAEASRMYHTHYFYQHLLHLDQPITSFSQSKDRLIVLAGDKAYLYTQTDQALVLSRSFTGISAVHVSTPQNILLLGDKDGNVHLYNLQHDKLQKTLKAHDQAITALAFAGQLNAYIITGSQDKTLQIINKRHEKTSRLVGHRSGIRSIDINVKYGMIAAASGDAEPRIWNFDGKLMLKLPPHAGESSIVRIAATGERLLTAGSETIRLWDQHGNLKALLKGHNDAVTAGAFANRSGRAATGDLDGKIIWWDENGLPLHTLTGHSEKITSLQFSEDDKWLYSASEDGTIRQWLLSKPDTPDYSIIAPLSKAKKAAHQISDY